MAESSYRTAKKAAVDEFIERKTHFIGAICPVSTEEEALAFLGDIRAQHREATHNCYAYVLRQNHLQRFSDDGEPQGTAGRPILEVLLREGITDVCVVVTRYFGGVLLGAGGLTRAYAHGCKIAVDAAGILTMHPATELRLTVDYSFYGKLQNTSPGFGAIILDTQFGELVTQTLMLRSDRVAAFSAALVESSAGTVSPEITGERFYPFPEE